MEKLEIRNIDIQRSEIRADAETNQLTGYAAVYNSEYENDYFIEVIKAGAFTRALSEKHDVRSLVDHIPTFVLGRTKSGTLRLKEDSIGLFVENDLPDTSYSQDLKTKMLRGDVDGMSFGFVVTSENWGVRNNKLFREILDLDLFDVSVVTYPAYKQTSASIRCEGLEDIAKRGEEVLRNVKGKSELDEYFHELRNRYVATL